MGLETDRKEWHKDLECWYQVWGLGIRVSRFGLRGFILKDELNPKGA